MAHSRAIAPAQSPSGDALTADLVGIGLLVGGEGSRDPNIEDTLLFASVEGMERDDLRVSPCSSPGSASTRRAPTPTG